MMLLNCYTQYVSILEKLAVVTRLKKFTFHSNPKEGNAQQWSNYHTVAFISHNSKVMLKILQARLQQYLNQVLSDEQTGFPSVRGTGGQIANIHWIMEKSAEFQKNIYFCFIDYAKAFDFMNHNKLEDSSRDGNILLTLPAS